LSLSYDIIKAHGGEIKVETLSAEAAAQAGNAGEGLPGDLSGEPRAKSEAPQEGGSEFIILLPV
jgi:signal transduction histidine kinase